MTIELWITEFFVSKFKNLCFRFIFAEFLVSNFGKFCYIFILAEFLVSNFRNFCYIFIFAEFLVSNFRKFCYRFILAQILVSNFKKLYYRCLVKNQTISCMLSYKSDIGQVQFHTLNIKVGATVGRNVLINMLKFTGQSRFDALKLKLKFLPTLRPYFDYYFKVSFLDLSQYMRLPKYFPAKKTGI